MKETLLFIPTFLLKHYKLLTLSEVEMMLILHLKTFFEEGNDFPTPEELGERMTVSASECMNIIRSLIQKGCLEIQQYQNENGTIYNNITSFTINKKENSISGAPWGSNATINWIG